MLIFEDFQSYNEYIGLPEPTDSNIDIGSYEGKTIRLQSEPVVVEFYRISIKSNFIDQNAPDYDPENPKAITGVFFNSPGKPTGWDIRGGFSGIYLQLSKKIIEENRFLFKHYLDYGEHEALYLTAKEEQEIKTIFEMMQQHYHSRKNNDAVLLSYVHVLVSLVEEFYNRQFSANPKIYNRILSGFQQHLNEYYNRPANQLPSVQYFADKLQLTPNYLGDIIKHFTKKSAIETIHDFVIKKAKELLEARDDLNNTEIAYELGFEYPNYFAKFFRKYSAMSPKDYRKAVQSGKLISNSL